MNTKQQRNKQQDKEYPILFFHKEDCCGCTACASICPVDAIEMIYDQEGFLYPNINISKCIKCQQCLKVCAFK